jgi:hypothetical protein
VGDKRPALQDWESYRGEVIGRNRSAGDGLEWRAWHARQFDVSYLGLLDIIGKRD